MLLPAKNEIDFELTPAGSHIAVCYRVIDLGTQQIEYKGQKKSQRKIMISWELCDEFMTQGKNEGLPFSIHKRYTLSSSEKASLRIDLESWRGRAFTDEDFGKFDIAVLLGVGCMLGVVHADRDGRTYSNIKSIMKLPKGMTCKPPVNPTTYFSLDNFNQGIYDSLSDSLKATIALSPEYQELKGVGRPSPNVSDDNHDVHFDNQDIPF